MIAMAILMGAMTSAILIASQAIPGKDPARAQSQAAAYALASMQRDLAWATSITALSATDVTVVIPDRGHGAAGPETVRYYWSGVAGDPLYRRYNGNTASVLVTNLASFALTWTPKIGTLAGVPKVALLASAPLLGGSTLSTDDQTKKTLLESWGMTVQVVFDNASQASLQSALASNDVLYVSEEINTLLNGSLFYNTTRGVVIEEDAALSTFGFVSSASSVSAKAFTVLDNTHPITSVFSASADVNVCASNQTLNENGNLAGGARILGAANSGGSQSHVRLAVLDYGAMRIDSQASLGRRVALPWGGTILTPFNFTGQMVTGGLIVLQRSLDWAAQPLVIPSVRVRLQTGESGAAALETAIVMPNNPRDPRP